jgi:hypothetical protein
MRRFLFLVLLLCPEFLAADHLPASPMARGIPEKTLSGIDIHRSHLKTLIERFGQPTSYKKYPETEEAAEVTWDKDGTIIHATINADDIAYAVEVSGKPSALAKTGDGLMLGGALRDLERIYGTRFVKQGNQITIQWKDGTEMRAKFNGPRIVSILLLAEVE